MQSKPTPGRRLGDLTNIYDMVKLFHALITVDHVMMLQEYAKFCKFSDSLLSRASKLADLIASLETALQESGKDAESTEAHRVKKPLDYHRKLH